MFLLLQFLPFVDRASKVLCLQLQELSFASMFIQNSSTAINLLKNLAKESSGHLRKGKLDDMCSRLRSVYRDEVKPLAPPANLNVKPVRLRFYSLLQMGRYLDISLDEFLVKLVIESSTESVLRHISQ